MAITGWRASLLWHGTPSSPQSTCAHWPPGTAPRKATVSYSIGRKRGGLRLGVRRSVRSRDERSAWLQPIRRNLAPNFTRMRFCFAIGEDTLADDFAAVRALVFPGDDRRLMDMRRSGTTEAIAGGADITAVAAKMARSSELHRTYAPVDLAAVRNADEARSKGRRKMRGAKPSRLERYRMRDHFRNKSCNSSKVERPMCNFLGEPMRAKHFDLLATPAGLQTATNSLEGYRESL
jgi:hypothetical protein